MFSILFLLKLLVDFDLKRTLRKEWVKLIKKLSMLKEDFKYWMLYLFCEKRVE